jgi:hypothetical protein
LQVLFSILDVLLGSSKQRSALDWQGFVRQESTGDEKSQIDVVGLIPNNNARARKTMKVGLQSQSQVVATVASLLTAAGLLDHFLGIVQIFKNTSTLHKLLNNANRVRIIRVPKILFCKYSFLSYLRHRCTITETCVLESYKASKTLKLFLENSTPRELVGNSYNTSSSRCCHEAGGKHRTCWNYVMREKDAMEEGKTILARTTVARMKIERGNKQFC